MYKRTVLLMMVYVLLKYVKDYSTNVLAAFKTRLICHLKQYHLFVLVKYLHVHIYARNTVSIINKHVCSRHYI